MLCTNAELVRSRYVAFREYDLAGIFDLVSPEIRIHQDERLPGAASIAGTTASGGRRRFGAPCAEGGSLLAARQGRPLLSVLAVLGLVLGLFPPARPAHADAMIVTSIVDEVGFCPSENVCTLRTALASAAPGETVQFGVTGVFLLGGPLTLTKNVTILGPGAASVVIDAQHGSRVFEVNSGVQVAMLGLTIRNGAASEGGGIRNSGTLTLTNSTITENTASGAEGGGIYNDGGTLTIVGSTLTYNTSPSGGGGAIYNTGSLTVNGSTLANNLAGGGGAIYNINGTVTVTNSTISGNTASQSGGAIYNFNVLTVTGSTLSGNTASNEGGAIRTTGTAAVSHSTLSANTSNGDGGAIFNFGVLTVTGSTLSGNAGLDGGAINNANNAGTLTLASSTVSGNSAFFGGGIYNNGTAAVSYSTLSSNTGPNAASIFTPGVGLSLRNSIVVAGSPGQNCGGDSVTSLGNNLSDTTSCFAGTTQGDIVTNAPLLGPLALHGPGTTRTHALLPGSPAVDGVTFNATDCPGPTATDQRGMSRPQERSAVRCDIGAFELEADTSPTISAIGPQTTDEDTPIVGLGFTVGDAETAAGSLTVAGSSSNQALVPNASLAIGGSGASRTLAITPAANQSGAADVTLTVSDGTSTTSTTITVTVTAVNDPPVNSVPGPQSVNESTPLVFTAGKSNLIAVADIDVAAGALQVALTATHGR